MIGEKIILKLAGMSITGSAVILLFMIFRPFLKRLPKKYLCMLWLIPFLRLLVPVSVPAPFSLLPVNPEPIVEMAVEGGTVPVLNTGIEVIDFPVNLILLDNLAPDPAESADPVQIYTFIFGTVWEIGAVIFLGINFFRYWELKRKTADAVPGEPGVYYSDRIAMPMVLGILRPRICLPSLFLREESYDEKQFVLEHETAHKKRRDHLTKLLVFAALTLHWFNPLVWAAYFMMCRDMEMACDEAVMEKMGEETKKAYSLALLHFEERRSSLLIPLAFGESHTKSRIKNILNYKRPGFWVNLAAILILGFAVRTLLTDPLEIGIIGGADGPTAIFLAGKIGEAEMDSTINIIGGADGPTSIFLAGKTGEGTQGAEAETIDMEALKGQPYGTGVELDYVSAEKISMHGYFGYLIFRFRQDGDQDPKQELFRAVTLSETGTIGMQGDTYTEIVGGDGGAMIFPDIYNGEKEQKNVYLYYEKNNTIEKIDTFEESGLQAFINSIQARPAGDGNGYLADAQVENDLLGELETEVRRQYGDGNGILYGPVAVPEFDSNVYGFLAADGGNVEDIWYGLWWENGDRIIRVPLFEKEL